MIQSWKTKTLIDVLAGRSPKGMPADLLPRLRRLLTQLNAAADITDLGAPPGNRLHRLTGDLEGQWSVRVNDQFRLVFRWQNGHAHDVWFVDYH